MLEKERAEDHPFPNVELNLIMNLGNKRTITKEELEIISNLLRKYLGLRTSFFHEN